MADTPPRDLPASGPTLEPAPKPALEVDGLAITLNGHAAVDGVSFRVHGGETLALVGESGCGKSLTALGVMGLLPRVARIAGGSVRVSGRELVGLPEAELRRLRGDALAMIFQDPMASLDPLMRVGEQVAESVRIHRRIGAREARSLALEMLREVGIPEPEIRFRQYPFEMSGGMCQRVMIAMALIGRPKVLIADEPTTALDVTIQAQILDLLRRLNREHGTALVLITHDMGVVADMADRVAVMYAGRVVETAPVERLFARPRHPYTRALLGSIPKLDGARKERLASIDGSVPDVSQWPQGCRFHPRCPLATGTCRERVPPLDFAAPDHQVACIHSDDPDGDVASAI